MIFTAGQVPGGLPGGLRVPGIHRPLVEGPRVLRVQGIADQVPEIDHRARGRVGVTGIDGDLVALVRLPEPAQLLVQVAEVPRRDGRILGVVGVDHQPVGLPGAFDVTLGLQPGTEAERRLRVRGDVAPGPPISPERLRHATGVSQPLDDRDVRLAAALAHGDQAIAAEGLGHGERYSPV